MKGLFLSEEEFRSDKWENFLARRVEKQCTVLRGHGVAFFRAVGGKVGSGIAAGSGLSN